MTKVLVLLSLLKTLQAIYLRICRSSQIFCILSLSERAAVEYGGKQRSEKCRSDRHWIDSHPEITQTAGAAASTSHLTIYNV